MPSALLLLLRLRIRAHARKLFRGARSTRGAVFLLMGLLLFSCWAGSAAIGVFMTRHAPDLRTTAIAAPMILFLLAVMTLLFSASKGIYFDRAEVDFLFPAPFTRLQLLAYKLSGSLIAGVMVWAVLSVFIVKFAASWPAAIVGCFLATLFNQFFTTTIVMIRAKAAKRLFTILRQGLLVTITALLIAGIFAALGQGPADYWTIAQRFQNSVFGMILLAPFEVFAHIFTSTRVVPDLVGWSLGAIAIIAAMGFIIVRLDADFLEASVATSQKMYERIQRMRRTGSAMSVPTGGRSRARLPMLPYARGAGPIAWRQLVTAMRNSRALLLALLFMALAIGPTMLVVNMADRATNLIVPVILWISVFLVRATAYDFRNDLDHMDWLRSLPVRPLGVVMGEIAAPVIVLSIFHALIIASVAVITRGDRDVLLAASAFVMPWNLFSVAIENLMFLSFPSRMVAVSPGDLQGIGRQMVIMMCKIALLAAGAGAAFGLGALAWLGSGQSLVGGGIAAWIGLSGVALVIIMLLTRTFRRFDPSLDIPA